MRASQVQGGSLTISRPVRGQQGLEVLEKVRALEMLHVPHSSDYRDHQRPLNGLRATLVLLAASTGWPDDQASIDGLQAVNRSSAATSQACG